LMVANCFISLFTVKRKWKLRSYKWITFPICMHVIMLIASN
jgi:hypothetical protein